MKKLSLSLGNDNLGGKQPDDGDSSSAQKNGVPERKLSKEEMEKTLKLSIAKVRMNNTANDEPDKSDTEPEIKQETISTDFKTDNPSEPVEKSADSIESESAIVEENNILNKTIKLKTNVVNTTSGLKAKPGINRNTQDKNLSSILEKTIRVSRDNYSSSEKNDTVLDAEEKSSSDLAKTLKVKLQKNAASAQKPGTAVKSNLTSDSLRNTLKLKTSKFSSTSEIKKPESAVGSLANTLKLKKSIVAKDPSKEASEDQLAKTIKLKTPQAKNNAAVSSALSNTIKLKSNFKKGAGGVASGKGQVKDVTSSKLIQLKPSVKSDNKGINPLNTNTIKIKVAGSAPKNKDVENKNISDKDIKLSDSEDEIKAIPENDVKHSQDLPSVDDESIKAELDQQSRIFETIKLKREISDAAAKIEVPPVISKEGENKEQKFSIDDVVIQGDDESKEQREEETKKPLALKENKKSPSAKTEVVPDISELKSVLDDIKNTRKKKRTENTEKTEFDGVSIEEESSVSILTLVLSGVTLFSVVAALYFIITSLLTMF